MPISITNLEPEHFILDGCIYRKKKEEMSIVKKGCSKKECEEIEKDHERLRHYFYDFGVGSRHYDNRILYAKLMGYDNDEERIRHRKG